MMTTSLRPRSCRTRRQRLRRLASPRPPPAGSIHGILRRHRATALYARPMLWTDRHADLLGARFHQLAPCASPRPVNRPGSPPSRGHLRPSPAIISLSEALGQILLPADRHPVKVAHAVAAAMSTLWPAAFSFGAPSFPRFPFFGDRVHRDAVRTQIAWARPPARPPPTHASSRPGSTRPCNTPPVMCYISRDLLVALRDSIFHIPPAPGRKPNEPVRRIGRARSKALMPANLDHDVQLVAIFIAMAQRHFYPPPGPSLRPESRWSTTMGPAPRPCFDDVKLRILTHDVDAAEFILYTALVTAKFLDRFHDPRRAPVGSDGAVAGLDIEYARIPVWPILGLRKRLGRALGEDFVGPFDPNVMETWDGGAAAPPVRAAGKRKRTALSEVFNRSFDEGTDDKSDHLGAKQQRLCKGSQIGVVV